MKNVTFWGGGQKYSNPPTYFQGVRTPNLRIYTPVIYLGSWIALCVLTATAHADIITQ